MHEIQVSVSIKFFWDTAMLFDLHSLRWLLPYRGRVQLQQSTHVALLALGCYSVTVIKSVSSAMCNFIFYKCKPIIMAKFFQCHTSKAHWSVQLSNKMALLCNDTRAMPKIFNICCHYNTEATRYSISNSQETNDQKN